MKPILFIAFLIFPVSMNAQPCYPHWVNFHIIPASPDFVARQIPLGIWADCKITNSRPPETFLKNIINYYGGPKYASIFCEPTKIGRQFSIILFANSKNNSEENDDSDDD
jgi:hypothetical protein